MCAPFKSNLLWVTSCVFSEGCKPILRVSQVGICSKQALSYMYISLGLGTNTCGREGPAGVGSGTSQAMKQA